MDLATAGTNRYSFGGKAGTVSGTFSGSEDATLVQLYSKYLEATGIGVWDTTNIAENSTQSIIPRSSGGGCNDPYCYPNSGRSFEGYKIKDGTTVLESGTRSDTPSGWCNVEKVPGKGALAGVWYLAAYWPKSCELNGGGNNVVVGIWPKQISGFNYWIAWPQYQVHDILRLPLRVAAVQRQHFQVAAIQSNCPAAAFTIQRLGRAAQGNDPAGPGIGRQLL